MLQGQPPPDIIALGAIENGLEDGIAGGGAAGVANGDNAAVPLADASPEPPGSPAAALGPDPDLSEASSGDDDLAAAAAAEESASSSSSSEAPSEGLHRASNHNWGALRITIRPDGQWSARCPFHRASASTQCKKAISFPVGNAEDRDQALRRLYAWCNAALNFDRKYKHG
eukprot:4150718-Lingulodinium_polyedra.AAC.1